MYRFMIEKDACGTYRLQLKGIQLIVDGFTVQNKRHYLKNPNKAIAFFQVDGLVYGVINNNPDCRTAEEFYEIMREQYAFFV